MRPPLSFGKITAVPLRKGKWTPEEDIMLVSYIKRYGIWNWTEMPKAAGLARSGKSCRLRWMNYLKPDIKHGNFSKEEVETIVKLHDILGNRWSAIAAKLPGRTDNDIKNFWHTNFKKRNKELGQSTTTGLQGTQETKRQQDPSEKDIIMQLPTSTAPKAADNNGGSDGVPMLSDQLGNYENWWMEPFSVGDNYMLEEDNWEMNTDCIFFEDYFYPNASDDDDAVGDFWVNLFNAF